MTERHPGEVIHEPRTARMARVHGLDAVSEPFAHRDMAATARACAYAVDQMKTGAL